MTGTMSNEARISAFSRRFDEALPAVRERAIGQTFEVRLDRKTTLTGVIQDVRRGRTVRTATNVRILFTVDMLCGTAQVLRTVQVRAVPQG